MVKSGSEGSTLGSILRGIGELVELVRKMDAEGKTEISRTGTFGSFPKRQEIGGSYGFTMKMGLPGKKEPAAGGVMHAGVGQEPSLKEHEPVIDVFDEGHFIRVVAELPAVPDEDVVLYMKENVLYLTVRAKDASFSKTIVLPERVISGTIRKSLRNDILEVRVEVQE